MALSVYVDVETDERRLVINVEVQNAVVESANRAIAVDSTKMKRHIKWLLEPVHSTSMKVVFWRASSMAM